MVMAGTIAPRVEIYTTLACRVHRPEYWCTAPPSPHNLAAYLDERDLGYSHPHQSPFDLVLGQPRWDDLVPAAESQNSTKTNPNLCAKDKVVQAAVAKLNVGEHNGCPVPGANIQLDFSLKIYCSMSFTS
jgi:hypothetical protein